MMKLIDYVRGLVLPVKLKGGDGDSTKFLRGDGTFQSLPGGGDLLAANNLGDVASAEASRGNLDVPSIDQALPRRMTAGFVSAGKTLTETPAALFAGASALASRRWLIARNESEDTRIRVGRIQANLQRDGEIIEPGAVMMIQLEAAEATAIYGASEGAAVLANIGEDTG